MGLRRSSTLPQLISDQRTPSAMLRNPLIDGAHRPLDEELRHDIPYLPHLGVGSGAPAAMEDLARRLGDDGIRVDGRVTELTVVGYDGTRVVDLVTVPLRPS